MLLSLTGNVQDTWCGINVINMAEFRITWECWYGIEISNMTESRITWECWCGIKIPSMAESRITWECWFEISITTMAKSRITWERFLEDRGWGGKTQHECEQCYPMAVTTEWIQRRNLAEHWCIFVSDSWVWLQCGDLPQTSATTSSLYDEPYIPAVSPQVLPSLISLCWVFCYGQRENY